MICTKCGKALPDDALVCDECGNSMVGAMLDKIDKENGTGPAPVRKKKQEVPPEKKDPLTTSKNDPTYTEEGPNGTKKYVAPGKDGKPVGMAWFKFVVFVQLFAYMIFDVFDSYKIFSGKVYDSAEAAAEIYKNFGGLQIIDYTVAGALILFVIAALVIRSGLAKFKKGAPTMYLAYLLIRVLFIIAQPIAYRINIGPTYEFKMTSLISIAFGLVMFSWNFVYFGKRRHLFKY